MVCLFIYLFPGKKVKATVWEVWRTSFFYLFQAFQVFTLCIKFKASYSRLPDCLLYFSVGEQYRCKKNSIIGYWSCISLLVKTGILFTSPAMN